MTDEQMAMNITACGTFMGAVCCALSQSPSEAKAIANEFFPFLGELEHGRFNEANVTELLLRVARCSVRAINAGTCRKNQGGGK